jgi:dihydropteroate synthase-like protein
MPKLLFVTGRLAEDSLRRLLTSLGPQLECETEVAVLGISVAALMHVDWVSRKLSVPPDIDRVILPGWCQGDLEKLRAQYGVPFERGPKELHDLPEHFGRGQRAPVDLSQADIEILAEINHAPRMTDAQLVALATHYRDSGADVIDLGCIPSESWARSGEVTALLRREGFRISIDSYERGEVERAVEAGAELVLSVNQTNLDWGRHLPAELIAVPDEPRDWDSLKRTVATLQEAGARFRIDPILEPIGFGFAASLQRYHRARQQWPDLPLMMGVGNLTELTEVDSAGVNMVLAGYCQELNIGSILTTEVIPWCQSAVREFDIARRIVRHAVRNRTLPKRVDPKLVMLRDPRVRAPSAAELEALAKQLRDPNFRLFAAEGELHALNRDGHRHARDPFELFTQLGVTDASHAFYLGYELAKATTALTLGKQYTQDEALDWGFLTRPEQSLRHREEYPG